MVNWLKLLFAEVILFSSYLLANVVYRKELNLFFLKDKDLFYETDLSIEINNIHNKIIIIDSLPSDLVDHFRKNPLKIPLEISLNQGQLEIFNRKSFVEYKNFNRKLKRNNNFRFDNYNSHFDYYFDSVGTNLLFPSELISSKENSLRLSRLLDNFAENFKIPKFYLSDFTNSIRFTQNNEEYLYLNDFNEKPCIDNLEGIRRLFPHDQWNLIKTAINQQEFVDSEFKTIKYYFHEENNKLTLNFKLAFYTSIDKFLSYYQSNHHILSQLKINAFSLSSISDDYAKELHTLISNNDNSNDTDSPSLNIIHNLIEDYGISLQRRLKGSPFGFENYELNHEIFIKQTNYNNNKKLSLKLFDLIPEQFDILFSTIKIYYDVFDEKGEVKTSYFFNSNNYKHFLALSFNITEMQHPVLWTYDKKRKISVILDRIKLIPNSKLRISYELRKRIINFESFENEFEFGYKIPSGIMLYSYENDVQSIFVTDQMYFNVPSIDNTMPFNVIALTWVVIGVFIIQTLNLFLGDKNKSFISKFLEKILSRFKSKATKNEKIKSD